MRVHPIQLGQGVSNLKSPGFIYIIRAVKTGMFKIGWATKPAERLHNLQLMSPDALVIEVSWPGNGRDEKTLHQQFAAARRHGEWFEGTAEILALITDLKANPPQKAWEPAVKPTPAPTPIMARKVAPPKAAPDQGKDPDWYVPVEKLRQCAEALDF